MKKFLFICSFIGAVLCANAQNVWQPDSVIQCKGKSAQEITEIAYSWASSYFATLSPVVDKIDNQVIVAINMPFQINNPSWAAGSGMVSGVVKIVARDGRFKIRCENFSHVSSTPKYSDFWSMGTVLEECPEMYKKGMKWKQKREVYKRLLEKLNKFAEQLFIDASDIENAVLVEEEDW